MAQLGRRIDRWNITFDGVEVIVEVYLTSEHGSPTFRAVCKEHDVDERDSDIARLKVTVRGKLKALLHTAWQPMLEVQVAQESVHSRYGLVTHGAIEVTVTSFDFAVINGVRKSRIQGYISDRVPESREAHDQAITVIPDTPENRAALELLTRKIGELRDAITSMMRPAQIGATMARVLAGGAPLALPASTGPRSRSKKPVV